MIRKYRKFWVAAVAAILIGVNEFFGITAPFGAEGIVNGLLAVLGAIGVERLPNDPA